MTCIKKNCRRRRVNATHCRECWNTVLVRRALRKPKPKRVQLAPSHQPLRGLNAQAGRAFLATCASTTPPTRPATNPIHGAWASRPPAADATRRQATGAARWHLSGQPDVPMNDPGTVPSFTLKGSANPCVRASRSSLVPLS